MKSTGAGDERRRHDRGDVLSTSLLLDLTTIAVDPAYVEAAARRAARGGEPADTRPGRTAALLLAVIGLLGAIAFTNTRTAAPQAARVRSGLVARVEQLTEQTDQQHAALELLRAQVTADRNRALTAANADGRLAARLRSLEFDAAAAPVSGPGVVVRLGDGPAREAEPVSRVTDRDVQRAVNVAWSAGAEAVAVNGERVGPYTAIRQAGESILVDYRPVTSPFEIAVVGDPERLESSFTVAEASRTLRAIARTLEFTYDVERRKRLDLHAAAAGRATIARPAGGADPQERSPQK